MTQCHILWESRREGSLLPWESGRFMQQVAVWGTRGLGPEEIEGNTGQGTKQSCDTGTCTPDSWYLWVTWE